MNTKRTRTLAILGLGAAIAAHQAFAAGPTLDAPPTPKPLSINEDGVIQWTMVTNPLVLVPANGQANKTDSANYVTAFNAWNAANGGNYNLAFLPSNADLTVTQYLPSLSTIGVGDLKFKMTLAYPVKPAQGPTPITGPWNNTNAVWTQSVTTNSVRGNPPKGPSSSFNGGAPPAGGFSSYMDIAAGPNPAPAYPFQYKTSYFYDDPERQGQVGSTVYWQGDAMLSSITDPTFKPNGMLKTAGTVNVYADVQWGFSVTGVQILPNNVVNNGPNTDIAQNGPDVQAVPEPAPTAIFGLGLVGLLVRRKRRG